MQTLLTLEVLYLYCSLWACNFLYIIADVALPSFFSTLVSAKLNWIVFFSCSTFR